MALHLTAIKKIIMIAIAVCLAIALVFTTVSIYVNSDSFRQRLVDTVNQTLSGQITLADHHLCLVSGQLTLSDLRLLAADGTLLAQVGRCTTSLFWPALVWRQIHLPELILDQVRLQALFDPQDRLLLAQALAPAHPEAPGEPGPYLLQVRVDEFQMRHAQVVFERPAQGWSGRVDQIDVQGRVDSGRQTGELTLTIGRLNWQGPEFDRVLPPIALTATYQGRETRPLSVDLKTETSRIALQGRLAWDDGGPQIDVMGDLDLALAEIQAWIPWPWALQGRAMAKLAVSGRPADPSANLHLEATDAAALGIEAVHLSADLKLDQRILAVEGVSGQGAWGELSVAGQVNLQPMFGHSLLETTAGVETVSHDLTVSGRRLRPWYLPMVPLPWLGTWQGSMHLKGSGLPGWDGQGKAETTLQVNAFHLVSEGRPVDGRLTIETSWNKGVLDVTRCQAVADGVTQLEARGKLDLDQWQLKADGQVTSRQIESLARALDLTLPQGQATVKLSAQGDLSRPLVQASLVADGLSMTPFSLGRLSAEAQLDAATNLTFSRLVLENQGSLLHGQGWLALGQQDPEVVLALDFEQVDPADFIALGQGAALLNGHMEVNGTLDRPVAELTLASSPITWGKLQARIEGAARWQEDRLSVLRLQLAQGQSSIELQGKMGWPDPPNGRKPNDRYTPDPWIEANLRADQVRLQDLNPAYKGVVTAQAALNGPLSQLRGTFAVKADQLDLAVQKIDSLRMGGRIENQAIYLEQAEVELSPGQRLYGSGQFHRDRRFDFTLSADGLEIAQIDLLGKIGVGKAEAVQGLMHLQVKGSGTLDAPLVTSEVSLSGVRLKGEPLHDAMVQMRFENQRFTLNGELGFSVRADYSPGSGEFAVKADFPQTDLAPYLAFLTGDPGWQGRLSGVVEAAGNRRRPAQSRIKVELADAALAYKGTALLSLDRLDLWMEEGMLKMPATRLEVMQTGYLTMSATGAVETRLTVEAGGRIPVAALEPFYAELDQASGNVALEVQAQGPWSQLAWKIDLILDRIAVGLPQVAQRIENLTGRLSMTPHQIDIIGVSGQIEEGRFTLAGQMQLEQLRPTQGAVTLSLQSLPLQIPDTLDLMVGGQLVLTGSAGQAVLSGQLVALEGTYFKDVKLNLLSGITQARRAEPLRLTIQRPPWMEAIALNVALSSRSPFLVDNNLAKLEITPDFKISGTLARPLIDGRANVTEGQLVFRGKTFTIKRGVVDFLNPYKIEPTLDIQAEVTIREWVVSMSVTGTLDRLAVKLSSVPTEAENDILSLIVFGRTSTELTAGQGGGTTEQMLAGLLASAWGQDLKKGAGMDILEVETGAQSTTDSADRIQVTMGKKLTPRMTLKYVVESNNGEMIQRAVSEYRFMEHLLASGFQDNKGRYGGELLFRLEFR